MRHAGAGPAAKGAPHEVRHDDGGEPRAGSQTLDRGLRVLHLLAEHPEGLTVTDLARRVGVGRTVVYRLLTTLEEHTLVRREATGRVRLGLGVLALATAVQPLLRRAATPVLRRLAEEVGATAHLTVADGDEALAVAVVEPSWTDFHVAYRVGSRHPSTAAPPGARDPRRPPRRPGDRPDVAVSVGELQAGAQGVSAGLRDVPGVEASVGVVALGELDVDRVGVRVAAAAAELARALRGRRPP